MLCWAVLCCVAFWVSVVLVVFCGGAGLGGLKGGKEGRDGQGRGNVCVWFVDVWSAMQSRARVRVRVE